MKQTENSNHELVKLSDKTPPPPPTLEREIYLRQDHGEKNNNKMKVLSISIKAI